MNIDDFIKAKSFSKIIGRGASKNCYDFDNFVLLETGHLPEKKVFEKLEDIIYTKDTLDKISVRSYKILDYKVVNDRIYILETKVNGDLIQKIDKNYNFLLDGEIFEKNSRSDYIDDYICRLCQLNNKNILKNFVLDYFKIIDSGLFVDASKPSNFLFDENIGISFIDIDKLNGEYDERYIFFYIIYNITYFKFSKIKDISMDDVVNVSSYITDIYCKLIEIYKELGYGKEMYSYTPSGTLDEYITEKIRLFISNVNDENINFEKGLQL